MLPLRQLTSPPKQGLRRDLGFYELVTLAVSSIGPLFSIMAAAGVILVDAGGHVFWLLGLAALPFASSTLIFQLLNQHFPNVGASYHWCRKVLGLKVARFQSWIIVVAYFVSLPPIVLPAAQYTVGLMRLSWAQDRVAMSLAISGWAAVAALILTRRPGVMARATAVLLALELSGAAVLVVIGFGRLGTLHTVGPTPPFHIAGLFAGLVTAATIMDGWEVDSYASGESKRPRQDPGIAGMLGFSVALVIYGLVFWLMAHEMPITQWGSTNPFLLWINRLDSATGVIGSVAVLSSTIASLWLTTYILSRALFVMGRDGLLPQNVSSLNAHGTPGWAVGAILTAVWLVAMGEVWTLSLARIIGVVLAIAGFFIIMEFFLDSCTAAVFLLQYHRKFLHSRVPHMHGTMKVVAVGTAALWMAYLGGFLWYGPGMTSRSVDWVIGVVLAIGIGFMAISTGARSKVGP